MAIIKAITIYNIKPQTDVAIAETKNLGTKKDFAKIMEK
jgi:hypothetical protein